MRIIDPSERYVTDLVLTRLSGSDIVVSWPPVLIVTAAQSEHNP